MGAGEPAGWRSTAKPATSTDSAAARSSASRFIKAARRPSRPPGCRSRFTRRSRTRPAAADRPISAAEDDDDEEHQDDLADDPGVACSSSPGPSAAASRRVGRASRPPRRAGRAGKGSERRTEARATRDHRDWPGREPTTIEQIRSLGKKPKRRKPSVKLNLGVAVSSFPIHFGGSDCFLRRYT